jgi:hypothetical protein
MVTNINAAGYKFCSNSFIQKKESLKEPFPIINQDGLFIDIVKELVF